MESHNIDHKVNEETIQFPYSTDEMSSEVPDEVQAETQEENQGSDDNQISDGEQSSVSVSCSGAFSDHDFSDQNPSPHDIPMTPKRLCINSAGICMSGVSEQILKNTELKNTLVYMRMQIHELWIENRILKKVQHRRKKALCHYDCKVTELSELTLDQTEQINSLKEILRGSKEKEHISERHCRKADGQLEHICNKLLKMQMLTEQILKEKDQLACDLRQTRVTLQETKGRVKI